MRPSPSICAGHVVVIQLVGKILDIYIQSMVLCPWIINHVCNDAKEPNQLLYPGLATKIHPMFARDELEMTGQIERSDLSIKLFNLATCALHDFIGNTFFFLLPLMFLDPPYKTLSGTQFKQIITYSFFLPTINQLEFQYDQVNTTTIVGNFPHHLQYSQNTQLLLESWI